MSVVLETPLRARGHWVATLSRVWVAGHGESGGLALAGGKQPLAVMIREPQGRVRAVDFDNRPLTRDQVEALCPGAWDAFDAACFAAGRTPSQAPDPAPQEPDSARPDPDGARPR